MINHTSEIYSGLAIQSTAISDETDFADLYDRADYQAISALALVEKFVEQIIKSKEIAFDVRPLGTRHAVFEKRLANFYQPINRVLRNDYPEHLQYSPRVEVFLDACKYLRICLGEFRFGQYLEIDPHIKWTYADIFNELILEIRHRCKQSKFRMRLKRHERNVLRRRTKAFMWLRALYDDGYSRYVWLMLNLGYCGHIRKHITPQIIQADLHHLFNNRRSNQLLSGIKGYICKIEEGDKSGLHAHLLIAYEASRRDDINLTKLLGIYWSKVITQGRGRYWNSNRYKKRNEQLGHGDGTGIIDYHDIAKRAALLKNVAYLCKADQYLKSKTAKFKTFWISKPPERKDSLLGRPRKVVDESCLGALEQYITENGWDHYKPLPHESSTGVLCGLSGTSASSAHS